MIPKKIHYCWFGENPLPIEAKKNIESWKKFCPNYEIIEWNEENFDIKKNDYIKEAYEAKKWAFITDFVRIYVLYMYGGIYMDTDVEVIKNLDEFLINEAFSGFESINQIPTGIMAAEPKQKLFKEFLKYYDNRHFKNKNGDYDMTTNVTTITRICSKYGLKMNNEIQVVKGFKLYPKDFFCPKSHSTGKIELTNNTACIHHFAGSWLSKYDKKKYKLSHRLCDKYGEKIGIIIFNTAYVPYRIWLNILEYGIRKTLKKIIKNI